MNNKNEIQKHIDEMMKQSESFPKITTSESFLDNLNSKLDLIEEVPRQQATIFSFKSIMKYAAVIAITFLNIGAVYTQLNSEAIDTESTESISDLATEYFPDYTSYSE